MAGLVPKFKATLVDMSRATGRYADWLAAERETVQTDAVEFEGDIPPSAGREPRQNRLTFRLPRALITEARDVLYSERGMAWIGGRLERRYSFEEIGLRQIVDKPSPAGQQWARASILQSQTPRTYGDWVSEHLASLCRARLAGRLVEPLLVPAYWLAKPYVARDLALLGVRTAAVTAPVAIAQATVVNKTRPGHFWTAEEAHALVTAMQIEPAECTPGRALYLSRRGERGEGPQRQLDNDLVEAAMEAAGVDVVRTAGMTPVRFRALAAAADTVFADHGSALYNLLYWKTRRIVELFPPNYWDPAFLFLADSVGIRDYHLWQIDDAVTHSTLTARIEALRSRPPG